jgi:c-di-GMP-binding flagellar brake protein YcgR
MRSDVGERRASPRYPLHVPIRLRTAGHGEIRSRSGDLSAGGLCFESPEWLAEGTEVEVELPLEDQRIQLVGTLLSCRASAEGAWRVPVRFVEPSTRFRMKLAEQILRIHELQRELSELRGEHVTTEEAATEWVNAYAREFAELYE